MSIQGKHILQEALSLPPEERLAVAEQLLSSLVSADQRRIQALWAEEAEDRVDAFESGKISSVPARKIFKEVSKQRG